MRDEGGAGVGILLGRSTPRGPGLRIGFLVRVPVSPPHGREAQIRFTDGVTGIEEQDSPGLERAREVRQSRPSPIRGQDREKITRQDEVEGSEGLEGIGLAQIEPRETDVGPERLRDDPAVLLREVAFQDLLGKGGRARAWIRRASRARDRPRAEIRADHLEFERGRPGAPFSERDRERVRLLAGSARGAQAAKRARPGTCVSRPRRIGADLEEGRKIAGRPKDAGLIRGQGLREILPRDGVVRVEQVLRVGFGTVQGAVLDAESKPLRQSLGGALLERETEQLPDAPLQFRHRAAREVAAATFSRHVRRRARSCTP